jgi:hypothetical protein
MSTTLEQHCRLLLRAYPESYRRDRGEEIVGTLLEATPQGRAWPLARDVTGLAVGGLRARAALNGQRATAENMRVAALTGVSAFLACMAVSGVAFAVITRTPQPGAHFPPAWQQMLTSALILLAVAAVWFSGRPLLRLTAITAALVAWSLTFPEGRIDLAALVALAMLGIGGARPGWRWGWPVALAAVFSATAYLPHASWTILVAGYFGPPFVIAVASLLWAAVDARPAVASGVFLLALWWPGVFVVSPTVVPPLVVIVLLAIMAWWLHRQSASFTAGRFPLRPSVTASTRRG